MSQAPSQTSVLSLEEKRRLLVQKLQKKAERGDTFPLSFAQQRLWLVQQLDPESAAYNLPYALRLRGALDVEALGRALTALVRRHETLRTVFPAEAGVPVQRVLPPPAVEPRVVDLRAYDPALREAQAARLARDEAAAPFDLAAGPLLRVAVARMADDDALVLLTLHHIVSDGWSQEVLVRELSELYTAASAGREAELPPLPVQFADFAVWQRGWLSGAVLEEHLAYWRRRLAGAPPLLELPVDRPRTAEAGAAGERASFQLTPAASDALRALARAEGATLFMTLLGAYAVLLSRYAGQDDVVVGTPVAGRSRLDVQNLIGFFVNMLALRTDLSGDPTFRTLVRRVRHDALEAHAHEDLPFEKLVDELQPERSLTHLPVFQVTFSFVAAPREALRLGTLDAAPAPAAAAEGGPELAKFEAELTMVDRGGRIGGTLLCRADLFDGETVRRMGAHLARVLEQVAADPDLPLSRLRLAGPEERARVVDDWNRTALDVPAACVHDLFAAQARRTPGAPALEWDGARLSYGELDARANRLAHHLAGLGVGLETRVGLLLDRGVEMVAATLAVLKAGGCCVPVDTSYPPERVALMLGDSGAPVLLTRTELAAGLDGVAARVVRLDAEQDAFARQPATAPAAAAAPSALAYVFYTSGSTGRPKGVMMGHREVVQYAAGLPACMPLGPGDRVAQASNASFDAAVFEIWGALLHGATLCGIDRDVLLSAPALARALRAGGITHLYQTAALFAQHVREQADVYASLRQLVFGAEAVGTEGVRRMLAEGRPARVLHEYGPTEATVWCTLDVVEEVPEGAATVPIGRPVPNARMYVLDPAGEPLPPGVPGELYAGGDGVVRGYLGRPALTAERFVPDPFSPVPGARLYRTGDRVRWRGDGRLEFMGRLDEQVKLRGFRIEPGEVETALTALPGVRQARVVVREDQPGDKRLVAYLVGGADPEAVRAALRQRVPEYMVPSAFVPLEALPLTPNGKLDRRALPAPDYSGAGEAYVAPRTPAEEVLAGIWAEVLRAERVGILENFFALGGHSLLATRVVSRIRAAFGVELPLRALFEAPTVAELAGRIEALRRAALPPLPPVVPVDRTAPLPLSFAQERLWLLDRMQPGLAVYNVPSAVRLRGALDVPALERALAEVVRRHESLRTVFAGGDGPPVQVVEPFAGFALPAEDLSALPADAREGEVRRRAAEEAGRPFDLEAGPLFRASLLRVDGEEHVLLVTMHHVVSDAWSMGIFVREAVALYAAFAAGAPSPLAELPVQYADFAVWQRAQLRGDALRGELDWWRAQLAGAPPLLELPTDRPRPAAQTYRGGRVPVHVPRERMDALRELGRREGATLYMVVLAAFQLLLGRYAASGDVVVGTPIAGRTRGEVEPLIGFFVNTLVLRTRLDGDPAVRELLRRVRETTLGAYEHQDLPFERLVSELQPERTLAHAPVFQVMFALQNEEAGTEAPGGLRVERLGTPLDGTKFDLTLNLVEGPGGLGGSLAYAADLFDAATVERMARHLVRVLEQLAADPGAPVSRLALLPDEERARVVRAGQGAAAAPADPRPLHARVADQAARTPEAPAVRFRGETMAYGELDARSNRLARHLRGLGVGTDARVGLLVERGMDLLPALLGILKAGAAYVPLDPSYPDDRLRFMAADSGAAAVVAHGDLAERMGGFGGPVVRLDGEAVAAESAAPPPPAGAPESTAYVLYTSGSTGTPKGVAVEHRSLCNYLDWFGRAVMGGEDFDLPLVSRPSFDASVRALFLPLLRGGCAWVLPEETVADPAALLEALAGRARVSFSGVPSLWAALVELMRAGEAPRPAGMRVVTLGGEALPPALVERTRALFPGVPVWNLYGPTETTVNATAARLAEGGPVTVGRPLDNARAYVLDGRMQPVPAGIPGELYAGGAALARGYLGRPALTAAAFVPDPFAGEPGARMYRTGDRARWTAAGDVAYLGRVDGQVKVRGFRIETGEIQAALLRHPGVDDCAVVVREDAPGDRRLAAYVVGAAGADELRAHLRRGLPEYMVPAVFVPLAALPRTGNGKLDARALPAPVPAGGDGHVAPRTPVEAALAGAWAEVLRLERVGVEDGFFELGGDSILAIQVVSRARRAGVRITPRQMFEHQTVAALAAVAGQGAGDAPAAEQGRVQGAVPLTPVQARFFAEGHPVPGHHNQSVLLAVDPAVPDAALAAALRAVLEHHDALRLRVRAGEDGWEQDHAAETGISLARVDLSGVDGAARDAAQRALAERVQASLSLERGPLGRAVLVDRGGGARILFIVLHHLAVDGVSWRILREDLERACAQAQAGAPVDLGAKTSSFRQWARALEAYAAGAAVRDEAAHWLAQGADGVAPLPADGAGGGTVADARHVAVALDAEETRALLQDVPAAYRTQINDALLYALAEAVGGWTGSPRVRLALEGHGREEDAVGGLDLTRTVGWFTSLYPVVLDTAGAAGPGARLARIKEQLRAVPARGIGYGALRYLSPDGEVRAALAAQPEPEILFNYLGQVDEGPASAARLRFAGGPRGRESAPGNRRGHALSVSGMVAGGRLQLSWGYGEGAHRRETVEGLAEAYLQALRGLIAHCREAGAGGYTPSDFPLAGVSQAELDAALAGRGAVEDLYPLAPLQEGLLFHALYGGGAQAYQVQMARRLEGPLDEGLLRRAWDALVARHAILRTSFAWQGLPRPLQVVAPSVEVPWTVEDWSGLDGNAQEAALDRYLAEDRARGFAPDRAPLLRCALFRVGPDAHWLVWNYHHLLMDGWSSARAANEVFRLYQGWAGGAPAELAPVWPYRDYVAWLGRRDPAAAEAYWRGVLGGVDAPTPLGVDRAAPAGAPMRPASHTVRLDEALSARLEEGARRGGVTLNTLLQAAWGVLLARQSGHGDVVFGTIVSGRPAELEGVEEMVGPFINTLPVRMRVPGNARLGDWLGELQRGQAEAREHGYAPLARVQGWSGVPRGTPLFESLYVFENYPVERSATGGAGPALRVAGGRSVEWTTYPLTLAAMGGARVVLRLSYDENRFAADDVERMGGRLARLLEQFAADPDVPLAELSLLGDEERTTLLDAWNRTERPFPRGVCVHDRFAERVRQAPDAPALAWGELRLTYAELDVRANRLAHHLRRRGVGPDARVGVLLERGPALVVSILAILKAGGCYVPLDPGYPAERLRMMLEDSGVRVLVTVGGAGEAAPGFGGALVRLDEAAEAIAAEPDHAPQSGATAQNLAYVVYTSGSTGRPKGVMVAHQEVVQLVVETDYVRLGPGDRVAQASNASFDALAFEAWGALLNGATLVGIPRDVLLSPPALRDLLREERITTLYQTTALLNQLTREQPDVFATLREVLFGGQASDPDRVRALLRGGRPRRLVHVYGPTETTAWCSWEQVEHVADDAATVSVGRPTGNARIYLLDGALRPVPLGVPGEAFVGGAGIVRGYLDRPALTAERFLPDPYGLEPGARMYRTGDRLRWTAAGALEFVGRLDEQVKIRGFRIEPGEVESALSAHGDVREARVIVREDVPGEPRLVAYVVGDADGDGLRAHLRASLPEYMVPAAFVGVERLPLTPNGKLDVKALPAPEWAVADRYVAPRTAVEEVLAEIWAEVLRLERVGVHDGFFELGGHSLLVIRVASRMEELWGMEVPLRVLFDAPTVAQLAALLEGDPRFAEATARVGELMRQLREMEAEPAG